MKFKHELLKIGICWLTGFALACIILFFSCTKSSPPSETKPEPVDAVFAGNDTTIYYSNYADSVSHILHAEFSANAPKPISYKWSERILNEEKTIEIGHANSMEISLKEGSYLFTIEAGFEDNVIRKDSVYVKVLGPFCHYKWKMISAVSSSLLDIDSDGVASTDLYAQFRPCYKDNEWQMNPETSSGYLMITIDNAGTVCVDGDALEGPMMKFAYSEWRYPFKSIQFGSATLKVNFPNDSTLNIEGMGIYPTFNYGDSIYANYKFRRM